MNTMRRVGFLGLALAALYGTVGCAGAPAPATTPAQITATPASEPGYAGSGLAQPSLASAPPPPEASAVSGRAEPAPPPAEKSVRRHAEAAPDQDRPGLGTQWGETRTSRISFVGFERADVSSPFASAALFYNDEEGARAMTASSGFRRTPAGMFTVANGLVSVGLRAVA